MKRRPKAITGTICEVSEEPATQNILQKDYHWMEQTCGACNNAIMTSCTLLTWYLVVSLKWCQTWFPNLHGVVHCLSREETAVTQKTKPCCICILLLPSDLCIVQPCAPRVRSYKSLCMHFTRRGAYREQWPAMSSLVLIPRPSPTLVMMSTLRAWIPKCQGFMR